MRAPRRAATVVLANVRCPAGRAVDEDAVVAATGAAVLVAAVLAAAWPWPLSSVRVGLLPPEEAGLVGPLAGLVAATGDRRAALVPLVVVLETSATIGPGDVDDGIARALAALELPDEIGALARWASFSLPRRRVADVAALVADGDWLGWHAPDAGAALNPSPPRRGGRRRRRRKEHRR